MPKLKDVQFSYSGEKHIYSLEYINKDSLFFIGLPSEIMDVLTQFLNSRPRNDGIKSMSLRRRGGVYGEGFGGDKEAELISFVSDLFIKYNELQTKTEYFIAYEFTATHPGDFIITVPFQAHGYSHVHHTNIRCNLCYSIVKIEFLGETKTYHKLNIFDNFGDEEFPDDFKDYPGYWEKSGGMVEHYEHLIPYSKERYEFFEKINEGFGTLIKKFLDVFKNDKMLIHCIDKNLLPLKTETGEEK